MSGYGLVYEGNLDLNGKKTKVAVKRLNDKYGQGLKEFLREIELLSGQQHENLITLVGYCDDEKEKIIVYEYAEHGSLDLYFRYRNTNYTLTWVERLKIAVDAARGLDHLHNHLQNNQVIIHRDIKCSNILLDHNWVAKISDFGLSKTTFSGLGASTVITQPCGTPGYVEPELKQFYMVNKKADVYSFGMVLFELLCGRLCNNEYDDDIILSAEVAKEYYANGKLDTIIDPSLREQMSQDSLTKFAGIAYKCLQSRQQRPLMDIVKKELEEALKSQVFQSAPTHSMSGMKLNLLKIPFPEIKDATKDFRDVIGRGDFGYVYEGKLFVHGVSMKVAVKRLNEEFGQGLKEFLTEIQLLSSSGLRHENIIRLVGYCDDGTEKITVYEYAEHGSLDRYIRCSNTSYTLTWLQRLKIVVDVARGLDHLHNHVGEYQTIVHRDIKSSSILQDDKWAAKISNFGLSKFTVSRLGTSTVISENRGTKGYVAPEHIWTELVTAKSDVYSFGMVLFEVLCGRLCYVKDEDDMLLTPEVAKECYDNNKLDKIIVPILREQMSLNVLRKFSAIAYDCIQALEQRPSMDVVKNELEETLKNQVLHWRSFISKHWYILNVEDLSPKNNIVMQHEEIKISESISTSCEEDITTEEDYRDKELPFKG